MPKRDIPGINLDNLIMPIHYQAGALNAVSAAQRDLLASHPALIPKYPPESLVRATEGIERARHEALLRERERDDLQRELVELQRTTAQRDRERDEQEAARGAARDAADAERDQVERKRKRRELYRWCLTTAIAVAGSLHAFGADRWFAHQL